MTFPATVASEDGVSPVALTVSPFAPRKSVLSQSERRHSCGSQTIPHEVQSERFPSGAA